MVCLKHFLKRLTNTASFEATFNPFYGPTDVLSCPLQSKEAGSFEVENAVKGG